MPFEELEEKEMARKNMIWPLIQERTTGQKKNRGRKADLYDWRDNRWPENTVVLPDYTVLRQYPKTKGNETKEDGEGLKKLMLTGNCISKL